MPRNHYEKDGFYAVYRGRVDRPTIYSSWSQVHPRVIGCKDADQQKFDTLQEARDAMISRGFTDPKEVIVPITEGKAGPLGHGKFYAVAGGRTTEVFTDWENAKRSIDGTHACHQRFRTQQEAEQFIETWKDAYADVWRREIRQGLDKGWKPKDMEFDAGLFLDRGNNNGTTKEDTEEKNEQSSRGANDDHELSKLEGLAIKVTVKKVLARYPSATCSGDSKFVNPDTQPLNCDHGSIYPF
ncbi:hypothetical protein RU639_006144 [Aspergillus parasiticus]